MDYFEKITARPNEDLTWNIPERKQGTVNIIGGNSQSFKTPVKIAEFLGANYPVENVNVVLPDVLSGQLPPLPNFVFLPSTDSGSFTGEGVASAMDNADFNLLIGDFSKNSITVKELGSAVKVAGKMTLLTRDAVDIIAEGNPERILMNENLILFASIPQLQKLLHAAYYPRMITLSQSLMQIAETLHKFTLSYPTSIITFNNGQVLIANAGRVVAVPLEKTTYSALTFWSGELAAKIVAMNLYNPNNFISSSLASLF